jgi:hypothetical protein
MIVVQRRFAPLDSESEKEDIEEPAVAERGKGPGGRHKKAATRKVRIKSRKSLVGVSEKFETSRKSFRGLGKVVGKLRKSSGGVSEKYCGSRKSLRCLGKVLGYRKSFVASEKF